MRKGAWSQWSARKDDGHLSELEHVSLEELALALARQTLAAQDGAVGAAEVNDEPAGTLLSQCRVPGGHREVVESNRVGRVATHRRGGMREREGDAEGMSGADLEVRRHLAGRGGRDRGR